MLNRRKTASECIPAKYTTKFIRQPQHTHTQYRAKTMIHIQQHDEFVTLMLIKISQIVISVDKACIQISKEHTLKLENNPSWNFNSKQFERHLQ